MRPKTPSYIGGKLLRHLQMGGTMRWNARAVREVGGGRWVAGRQASPGAPWNGARAEADGPAAASSPVEAGSVADAEGLLDSAAGAGPAADAAADADADALEHLGDEIA